MTRVAFLVPGWMGGRNYLRNLLLALDESPDLGVKPVLLAGRREQIPVEFSAEESVRTSLLDPGALLWRVRHRWRGSSRTDGLLDWKLRSAGVSVLSHFGDLGEQARTPTIGWIPDFQHHWLPAFFSPEERQRRDIKFESTCRTSRRILLSSEAARRDLVKFYPQAAAKARVLRFVDCSTSRNPGEDIADLEARYCFRRPYLLLPNQFWIHKNHRTAMEAIRILHDSGRSVTLLATGDTHDHRSPTYFDELLRERAASRLEEEFRVLGPVPYPDLVGLMRHAAALVNPSLFEGWSTVVEEAKSLGKQMLLSDIPVHREQAPERGTYFDPADAKGLAECFWRAISEQDPVEEERWANRAAELLPGRREDFARTYAEVLAECI